MKFILHLVFIINVSLSLAQVQIENDTILVFDHHEKFKFEKFNNSKTKKLKQGKGITLDLTQGDSIHSIYGLLYESNDSYIKIDPYWEQINFDTTNFRSKVTYEFDNS